MEIEYIWGVLAVIAVLFILIFGNSIPKHGSVTEGDVIVALESGHKVRAIKYYRSVHGVSLKEAKNAIEKLTSKHALKWGPSKIQPLIASFQSVEPLRFPPPRYNPYPFKYQRSNNKLRYSTYFHFSDIIKRAAPKTN